MRPLFLSLCGILALLPFCSAVAEEPEYSGLKVTGELVRVAASPAMYDMIREAVNIVKEETGVGCKMIKAPSSAGIASIPNKVVEIAFTNRAPTPEERAAHPDLELRAVNFGEQVLVLAVSRDVWEGGVHAISEAEMRQVYERRITNWKELGGPDLAIVFFSSDEGRGVWELLAEWLYQNTQKAPLGRFSQTKSNEEARDAIEFSPGAMGILSPGFVKAPSSNILGIKMANGEVVMPTPENVKSGKYPLKRSMFVIVNERPAGNARPVFNFFRTESGRKLLEKWGCIPHEQEEGN